MYEMVDNVTISYYSNTQTGNQLIQLEESYQYNKKMAQSYVYEGNVQQSVMFIYDLVTFNGRIIKENSITENYNFRDDVPGEWTNLSKSELSKDNLYLLLSDGGENFIYKIYDTNFNLITHKVYANVTNVNSLKVHGDKNILEIEITENGVPSYYVLIYDNKEIKEYKLNSSSWDYSFNDYIIY